MTDSPTPNPLASSVVLRVPGAQTVDVTRDRPWGGGGRLSTSIGHPMHGGGFTARDVSLSSSTSRPTARPAAPVYGADPGDNANVTMVSVAITVTYCRPFTAQVIGLDRMGRGASYRKSCSPVAAWNA